MQPEADKTLEKRIERLEERLDETIAGENAPTINRSETLIDRSEAEDALVRAVSKAKSKRDGGKS